MRIVARDDRATVIVFEEPLPCCHLRRQGDEPETVIGLPIFEVVIGPRPTPAEWQLLLDHAQVAIDAWRELNE